MNYMKTRCGRDGCCPRRRRCPRRPGRTLGDRRGPRDGPTVRRRYVELPQSPVPQHRSGHARRPVARSDARGGAAAQRRSTSRPGAFVHPARPGRRRRTRGHLVRPRQRLARDRRSAGAVRPGVERPRVAVAARRARSGCTRCRWRSRRCRRLDAVVISHDHYDHLDMATIRRLARAPRPRRSSYRSASGRTSSAGACRLRGSSSWTGTSEHDRRRR